MDKGLIYAYVETGIFARPNLIKIGKTVKDSLDRISEVRTGNASGLECYKHLTVPLYLLDIVEKLIHKALVKYNVRQKYGGTGGTEWFVFENPPAAVNCVFGLMDEWSKRDVGVESMAALLPAAVTYMQGNNFDPEVVPAIVEQGRLNGKYGGRVDDPECLFAASSPEKKETPSQQRSRIAKERKEEKAADKELKEAVRDCSKLKSLIHEVRIPINGNYPEAERLFTEAEHIVDVAISEITDPQFNRTDIRTKIRNVQSAVHKRIELAQKEKCRVIDEEFERCRQDARAVREDFVARMKKLNINVR